MPIINEYPSMDMGQGVMPEMMFPESPMLQANAMPAVRNMGGNAVTGYAIRYTSIGELEAQYYMHDEMETADLLLQQRFGVTPDYF